jgi:hypothetical protein
VDTKRNRLALVVAAGLIGSLSLATASQAASQNTERLQQAWRAAITRKPVPAQGCFTASYPLVAWREMRCAAAPQIPFVPATGRGGLGRAGNGDDYAARTKPLTSSATGWFPAVKRLKSEQGANGDNDYSLQLNSNFMSGDKACAGAAVPANCLAWEQFVYASSYTVAFMQYWLINYNTTCPAGWITYSSDCYKNSNGVAAPQVAITQLPHLSLAGTAVVKGVDTLVFTTATHAYSTTGNDNVVYLAKGWHDSEFNVIGDGNASGATFNAGASVTVQVDVVDGGRKPVCASGAGTTGETNNLTLGLCKALGGATPNIKFVESN